jgi:hypothetical protein
MVEVRPGDDQAEGLTAMSSYNRPGGGPSGGGGRMGDDYGPDRAGYWPDGTSKSTTSQGDRPDPRYPQKPPGVPVPGKNFYPRPALASKGYRGSDGYVNIGPGSSEWTAGADDVLNKRSLTTSDVNRTPRKPR